MVKRIRKNFYLSPPTLAPLRLGGRIILSALSASVVNYPNKSEKEQTMKTFLMSIALTIALVFMSIADFLAESPLRL
jgi:hypothetical protein